MSRNSQAALALSIGTAAILITMAFHPTGSDVTHGAGAAMQTAMARAVHALAIGALPLLSAGMLVVSWRLRAQAVWSLTATVSYLLAIVAVMIAATASGFIATSIAERAVAAVGAERDLLMRQLHYTGTLNQAFATVYVGLTSMAFACWAMAMRADGQFPRGLWWLGLAVAVGQGVGIASGHLRLDVHGFGAVVIAQSAWVLWSAWALRGSEERERRVSDSGR